MPTHLPVADVERLVLDEQTDDLPVRDVDDGVADLRVAVSGFGVRQRPDLMEPVQVGPRQAERLALVQVGPHADVAVGEREHGLGLRQPIEVELGFTDRPRLDGKRRLLDHELWSSSSERSLTTTSAPCRSNSSA